ncbi:MAG: hypothetical protein K9N35_05655 [Candidatus Marinimicrobia bacterium]|nr:hypothetical protein [Candidatus Neomarinimicrobiota bacterium]
MNNYGVAETNDHLKHLVRMLLECSHDMPYRSGDNSVPLRRGDEPD